MSDRDPLDPQIIKAGETPRGAFVEVAVSREGEIGRFRFRSSAAGRTLPYRYFFAGHGGRGAPVTHILYVRIERGEEERTIEFDAPEDLVSNLQWFRQIPSLAFAGHLRAPA
jgi:hypothetical protein